MSVTALAGNSNREECFSDQINHLSKVECLAIRQLPTFNCFTTHCGRKFWITADSPSGGVQLVGLWFCVVVFFKGSCTKLFYCNCSFCCSPHTSMETTALIQTLNRGDVFFWQRVQQQPHARQNILVSAPICSLFSPFSSLCLTRCYHATVPNPRMNSPYAWSEYTHRF